MDPSSTRAVVRALVLFLRVSPAESRCTQWRRIARRGCGHGVTTRVLVRSAPSRQQALSATRSFRQEMSTQLLVPHCAPGFSPTGNCIEDTSAMTSRPSRTSSRLLASCERPTAPASGASGISKSGTCPMCFCQLVTSLRPGAEQRRCAQSGCVFGSMVASGRLRTYGYVPRRTSDSYLNSRAVRLPTAAA